MFVLCRARRTSGLAALAAGLLLATGGGCFHVSVVMPDTLPTDSHRLWVRGFFWGAIGTAVHAGSLCAGRQVARVSTQRSAGNLLVSWLTLGIYTPSTVTIVCGQPVSSYAVPAVAPSGYSLHPTNVPPEAQPALPLRPPPPITDQ